jgi:hypothetical protein
MEGVDVHILVFLASALVGGEWRVSWCGCPSQGETDPGTHRTVGWVGPRAGVDDMETFQVTLPWLLGLTQSFSFTRRLTADTRLLQNGRLTTEQRIRYRHLRDFAFRFQGLIKISNINPTLTFSSGKSKIVSQSDVCFSQPPPPPAKTFIIWVGHYCQNIIR